MKKYGKRLRLTPEEEEMIYESRSGTITNVNGNTALDIHLEERGIKKEDVVSVKHWQSSSGELRFSIVTKEDDFDKQNVLKQINNFIAEHAPYYPKRKKVKKDINSHLLVINPADIHIGKYSNDNETGDGYDIDTAVERVIEGINGILWKTKSFNIDKILFCLGNDILHIDNVYNTTTKGTSQDVDGKWWEHYEIALALYVKLSLIHI